MVGQKKWDIQFAGESLDYNTVIEKTVIGSKVDITVNDEKLKINLKDVDANDSDCVQMQN